MTNIDRYLQGMRGKKVDVLGLGRSNLPLIELLLDAGALVCARDRQAGDHGDLERRGARLITGERYLEGLEGEVIFRTPAMRPDLPELLAAKARGARLSSESELFFETCPGAIIAVTGSSGKSTTCSILFEMLKNAGLKAYLGGNIGTPLLPFVGEMDEQSVCVFELSSFQLMGLTPASAVAVITNLSPNHLDYHRDLEEYYAAKLGLLNHCGRAVLNYDCPELRAAASEKTCWFTAQNEPPNGAYVDKSGQIVVRCPGGDSAVMHVDDIGLIGRHNVENYLAAITALWGVVDIPSMKKTAQTFKGVEHRLELVAKKDGVSYINDSIATSPDRTIAGLRCFSSDVILIAGGYDKQLPFDELAKAMDGVVKTLVLTGDTAPKIAQASQGLGIDTVLIDNFDDAVRHAARAARAGDTVLLSPACASYGQFRDFEERGRRFKELCLEEKGCR